MTVAELEREVQAEEELSHELGEYAGEWVAVKEHKVVAHASTLKHLLGQVKKEEIEGFFQVPKEKGAICLY